MQNFKNYIKNKLIKENLSFYFLVIFFFIALFNPIFQKYDYGAGFPVVVLFSFLLIFFIIFEFKAKREKNFFEKLFLLLFAVFYFISFYFSQTKNIGFPELIAYLSIIPFYLIFAYKKNVWSDKVLKFLTVCGFLAVSLGFILYFLLDPTRMSGPFFNILYHSNFWPNAFASFLLMIWPIYLIIFKDKWKITNILVISFVISALFLTFSRGALIAFLGQVIILLVYFLPKINIKTFVISFLVLVFSLSFFFYSNTIRGINNHTINVSERITFQNDELLTSGQERKDFWIGSIKLLKEKPLTGFGPFSFRYAFNPIQNVFLGSSDHSHNIFLKFGSENGIFTMLSFILFLLTFFIGIALRFNKLNKKSKDFVAILSVCVVGVLAHSLIDYNFNFFQNLVLFFTILILIKSETVKEKNLALKKDFLSLILVVFVFLLTVFQVSIFAISYFDINFDSQKYSLYQRYSYLENAEKSLFEKDYLKSLDYLDKQLILNKLDDKAYYLKAVVYCSNDFEFNDLNICKENFKKALELNPKNDVFYYRDYLRVLEKTNDPSLQDFRKTCLDLFNMYYGYTKNNVHFTAYTSQVEGAYEMAEILLLHLDEENSRKVREKQVLMMQYAKEHRGGKTF